MFTKSEDRLYVNEEPLWVALLCSPPPLPLLPALLLGDERCDCRAGSPGGAVQSRSAELPAWR